MALISLDWNDTDQSVTISRSVWSPTPSSRLCSRDILTMLATHDLKGLGAIGVFGAILAAVGKFA